METCYTSVEENQCQKIACLVGHVFQLLCAAMFDRLIHKKKPNRCNGCATHHSSQREHSCPMMDNKNYHNEVREKNRS
ncbi:hypothetical protein ACROYT_G006988 [Oculina patagonica]